MKMKQWKRPEAVGQMFEPNEYVAACFSLACDIGTQGPEKTTAPWNGVPEYNYTHGPHSHAASGETGTCADANANRVITDNGGVSKVVGEQNKDQGWINGAIDSWSDNDGDGIMSAGDTIYWHTFDTYRTRRWNHRGTLQPLSASNPNHS